MRKLLVFGHQNPDTDAIASAIAFAHFLRAQGQEAEAVALGPVNDETAYALAQFGFEAPRVVDRVGPETDRVALVDHNEPQQSVADIQAVQVDYVVDHHRIAGFETSQPLYYRAEPIGSTASILYKLYREHDLDLPQNLAGLMLSAVISDTLLLKSPTCTPKDRDIAQALADIAGVDLESYSLDMLKAGTQIAKRSDADLLHADAKDFTMGAAKVRIGQVNAVGFEEVLARKASLVQAMEGAVLADGLDLFLLVITDIIESNSLGLVAGSQAEAVAQAFVQPITHQEVPLPNVVSRKKQIVPPLTAVLAGE